MLPSKFVRGTATTRAARLLIAVGTTLGATVLALGAHAANPGSLRTQADVLRARQATAIKAEQAALLDLYALETSLGRATVDLASLRRQIGRLRLDEAAARRLLAIARSALQKSEIALGQELRVLYERGEPNAIAVLLGSESLDAALEQLDSIDRSARDHRRIIDQTLAARKRSTRLAAQLKQRQVTLRGSERRLSGAVTRLQQSRDARATYIRQLRVQRHLAAARISSLEAEAAAAERKSRELAEQARVRQAKAEAAAAAAAAAARAQATTTGSASTTGAATTATRPSTAPTAPAVTVATSETPEGATLPADGASAAAGAATGERTLTVSATAYTLRGRTATGLPTSWGIVAVDPNVIPLGTRMTIPGYGEAIAADTGSAVRGATIDVWVPDGAAAAAFGRRTITIVLH